MTRIIGIDPSLTGTGLAFVDTDDHLVIPVETLTSTGKITASTDERLERILAIVETVIYKAVEHKSDLAVIEAPAFSRNNAGTWDRAGLWWLLVSRLSEARIETVTVPPTTRAKYATGKGNDGKDAVLLAVARRYPHVDISTNDEADALVLAAIGAHLVGHPIDELPKTHLDALTKVARPAGVAA